MKPSNEPSKELSEEPNYKYPVSLTPRMKALIRAFGSDKPTFSAPEIADSKIEIPSSPDAHFQRNFYGWNGFAIDYPGQLGMNSSTDNVAATPGGPQVGGTLLDAVYNRVTTVATAGDSVVLIPAVISSITQFVINCSTNAVKVWVFSRQDGLTDRIDSGAGVSFFNVPAGKTAMFFTTVPTHIGVILSA